MRVHDEFPVITDKSTVFKRIDDRGYIGGPYFRVYGYSYTGGIPVLRAGSKKSTYDHIDLSASRIFPHFVIPKRANTYMLQFYSFV
jgi:hypothetical protein